MPINLGGGTGNVTYSNGNFYDSAGNVIVTAPPAVPVVVTTAFVIYLLRLSSIE